MDKKLKILCFHGFGTNAEFMKLQNKHINKLLSPYADCVYLNGFYKTNPNLVESAVTSITGDAPLYSWFEYKQMTEKELMEDSLKNMVAILDAHGPFDGMIGFSQGGAVLHFLILLKAKGLLKHKHLDSIKFAIFVCGVWWRFKEFEPVLNMIDFPTLHIVSRSDFTLRGSSNAVVRYLNPTLLYHGEGHKMPRLSQEDFIIMMKFIKAAMTRQPITQKLANL